MTGTNTNTYNKDLMKKRIDDEIELLNNKSFLFVVIGINDLSIYFLERIKHLPGFIGVISDGGHLPDEYRCYQMRYADLVYWRSNNLRLYIMTKNGAPSIISRLRDVGIEGNIHRLGYTSVRQSKGSKRINTYDPLLGKTRIDDDGNPELVVFEDRNETSKDDSGENVIRILSIGGSTSDPFFGNMKSWPEYLYEKLSSMGIACEVIAAGMATYDSFMELKKLIRDGVLLRPDIVISYSGFNEGIYSIRDYPFSLKGDDEIARHIVENEVAKFETGIGEVYPLEHVSLGLKDERSLFQRWYDNERMMHGICTSLGISFIAALQPVRNEGEDSRPLLYREALPFFHDHNNPDWMIDMTSIFDDVQDIYIDSCHVVEYGNRRIAQFFLKEVLRLIDECEGIK